MMSVFAPFETQGGSKPNVEKQPIQDVQNLSRFRFVPELDRERIYIMTTKNATFQLKKQQSKFRQIDSD
jgi:hypothetical protein